VIDKDIINRYSNIEIIFDFESRNTWNNRSKYFEQLYTFCNLLHYNGYSLSDIRPHI